MFTIISIIHITQCITILSHDLTTLFSLVQDKPLDVTSSTAVDRELIRDLEEVHISFGGHLYLNWSSPGVQSNMMKVFDFWLNLGVDGFYLKNIHLIQVNSPEIILDVLHNLKQLLLIPRSSHPTDHDRSSAYLSSSSPNVGRRKRDSLQDSKEREGISDQKEEQMLKNFEAEIEQGFDEGLEGYRNISQSNHSSFFEIRRNSTEEEEEDEKEVRNDAGDLREEGIGEEMKDETRYGMGDGMMKGRRKKVVKRRSEEEKQRGGQEDEEERKGLRMPSRILMASKYSLDLLSDQIRKHFELKYFSSLKIPFPKHTIHSKLNERNEKVEGKNRSEGREGSTDKEKSSRRKENGIKREKFDGKQKEELGVRNGYVKGVGNVRQEYERILEVVPDLNSMKEQRKGYEEKESKRMKKVRKEEGIERKKREIGRNERKNSSSNQAKMDEHVSTHSNILQAIQSKIDDHQRIHLEIYGNKHEEKDEESIESVTQSYDHRNLFNKTSKEGNDDLESYKQQFDANDDHDLGIWDQVLMKRESIKIERDIDKMTQSDDSSILSSNSNIMISMKSNERNKNNNNNIFTSTTPKSVYSYFDLMDIYLDIQLNQTENIRDQINSVYINEPPSHPWVNWNIGSSITSRLATRLGSNVTLTSMFLLLMLPGTVTILYGDELALKNSINPTTNKVRILFIPSSCTLYFLTYVVRTVLR